MWAVLIVDSTWDTLWDTWVAKVVFVDASRVVTLDAVLGIEVLTASVLGTWEGVDMLGFVFVVFGDAPMWLEVTAVAFPARKRHQHVTSL